MSRWALASSLAVVATLPGTLSPAAAAPPDAPSVQRTLDARIVNVIPMGERVILVLNKGTTAGVKVGDKVRTACRDEVAIVTDVYRFNAKAKAHAGFVEHLRWHSGVVISLGGQVARGYCPASVRDRVRTEDRIYVTEVARGSRGLEVKLDAGELSQLAIGDEVRFACVDGLVAHVRTVTRSESWASLPSGWEGDPCQLTLARATLRGMASEAYCPAATPDMEAPRRLKARVLSADEDDGWWRLTIDKGARDGLERGQAVQLPCEVIQPNLWSVGDTTSHVRVARSHFPDPPEAVWINLNGTHRQPFCFHTPATCPSLPALPVEPAGDE